MSEFGIPWAFHSAALGADCSKEGPHSGNLLGAPPAFPSLCMKLYQGAADFTFAWPRPPTRPSSCFSAQLQMGDVTGTRVNVTFWDAYQNLENTTYRGIKLSKTALFPQLPAQAMSKMTQLQGGTKQNKTKQNTQSCNVGSAKHQNSISCSLRGERISLVSSKQNGQQRDLESDKPGLKSRAFTFLHEKPPFPVPDRTQSLVHAWGGSPAERCSAV